MKGVASTARLGLRNVRFYMRDIIIPGVWVGAGRGGLALVEGLAGRGRGLVSDWKCRKMVPRWFSRCSPDPRLPGSGSERIRFGQ